jgi:hypothetical protein
VVHVETESSTEGELAPAAVPAEKAYDKSTSFFDSISCESLDRLKDDDGGGNARSDRRRHERSLNAETFGRAANDRFAIFSSFSLGCPTVHNEHEAHTCVCLVGERTTAEVPGAMVPPALTRLMVVPPVAAPAATTSPWTTGPLEEAIPQVAAATLLP